MRTEKMLTSAQIIRKRRLATETRQGYVSLMIRVLVIAVIGWLLFTQVFFVGQAKGNDMFPAVKDGDLVIGFRLQKNYLKDDDYYDFSNMILFNDVTFNNFVSSSMLGLSHTRAPFTPNSFNTFNRSL